MSPRLRSQCSGGVGGPDRAPGEQRSLTGEPHHPAGREPTAAEPDHVVGVGRPRDRARQAGFGPAVAAPRDDGAERGLARRPSSADAEDRDPFVEAARRDHRAVPEQRRPVPPPEHVGAQTGAHPARLRERREETVECGAVVQHVGRVLARGARRRPPLGGHPRGRDAGDAGDPGRAHRGRKPADDLPAHLEVAGPALVVRGVEDEAHVVAQLFERVQREPGEDPLTLEVRVGRRIDRAHGFDDRARVDELPAHQHPEPGEPVPVGRDPRRRRPERVLLVLPREQRLVPRIGFAAE